MNLKICPECDSSNLILERSVDGLTKCSDCGYARPHMDWYVKHLLMEIKNLNKKIEILENKAVCLDKNYILRNKNDEYVLVNKFDRISVVAWVIPEIATRFNKSHAELFKLYNSNYNLEIVNSKDLKKDAKS